MTSSSALVGKIEKYGGESRLRGRDGEGRQAIVRTRVDMRQGEVAIDYRLGAQGDRWLIYDVMVEAAASPPTTARGSTASS